MEIAIDSLAFGGSGVGRIAGKACFVPLSAPGDRLKVSVVKEHRSWTEARVSEILEPSPLRTEPFCPHFGSCGGCDWQHIKYSAQCDAKRSILIDSLLRIGTLNSPPVAETVPADLPVSYRARAQFKLFKAPNGLKAGFYRRSSRHVVDLPDGCPLVTPAVNMAFKSLKNLISSFPDADRIPQITIDEGEEGAFAVIHYIGHRTAFLKDQFLKNRSALSLVSLFIQTGKKETLMNVFGGDRITYRVPFKDVDIKLGYEIGGFSQVNRYQNYKMINLVRMLAGNSRRNSMIDIYCGNGNISLPLSDMATEVTGIEEYPPSIASAVDNSSQASINNSTFICADAAEGFRKMVTAGRQFDLLILDPPRSGAAELIKSVPESGAADILYISCDPATLARDISVLSGQGLYKLETAVPLDMFPNTAHLETIALLKRI